MEKVDVLVKGVPLPIHHMFKGLCSLSGKSTSDGIIEAMISYIDKASGGQNENLKGIVAEYQQGARRR